MASPIFLYVEDDPMSRQVMDVMLTKVLRYSNVTIFEDSHDFLARVHALATAPTIVFLDIQVEPLDGYAMLNLLRADEKFSAVTVIALTASVMAADVEQLQQAGFNGLISKPLRPKTFPDLVEKILVGQSIWYVA